MDKGLVVFGLGEFAELAHYYFGRHAKRRVDAFTVDAEYARVDHFGGLPVLAFDEMQRRFPPATHELFIAIGYSQRCRPRKRAFLQAQALGYSLPSFVHESAVVARNAVVGANCLLREQTLVSPFAAVGDNIYTGGGVSISHHVRVDSHVYLAGGCVVNGSAVIGERCFIGSNATVRDRVRVGEGCIVGGGALIMSDCPADGVYVAAPTLRSERR